MKTRTIGIYVIRRIETGDCYVGKSVDVEMRWALHRSGLRRDCHSGPRLQNAWNKYGEQAFEFVVIEQCDISQLYLREQHYIDTLQSTYNTSRVADVSGKDHILADETKLKIASALRGNTNGKGKWSDERRAAFSAAVKGRPKPGARGENNVMRRQEVRDKVSAAQRGVPRPYAAEVAKRPERNAKVSASMMGNQNGRKK